MLRFEIVLVVVLLAAGCSKPPPVSPKSTETDADALARRSAIRDQLRQELGADYDAQIPEGSTQELVRGARVYRHLCEGCHGLRGDGAGGVGGVLHIQPADLSDPAAAAFFSDQAKLHIIRNGIPGSPMIGWSGAMSERDLLAVFQYVRSLAPAAQRSTSENKETSSAP